MPTAITIDDSFRAPDAAEQFLAEAEAQFEREIKSYRKARGPQPTKAGTRPLTMR